MAPSLLAACTQPLDGSQLSAVQPSRSSQASLVPETQRPAAQWSDTVHALPSEHDPALAACWQMPWLSQLSSVQGFSSLHAVGAPAHAAAAHTSPTVHGLPSSQGAALAVCTQTLPPASQPSSVHGLPSPQALAETPVHTPPAQVSDWVQALPSSQLAVLAVCVQPLAPVVAVGSQLSLVHPFASSQVTGLPPWQVPPAHASLTVQALPLLHGE